MALELVTVTVDFDTPEGLEDYAREDRYRSVEPLAIDRARGDYLIAVAWTVWEAPRFGDSGHEHPFQAEISLMRTRGTCEDFEAFMRACKKQPPYPPFKDECVYLTHLDLWVGPWPIAPYAAGSPVTHEAWPVGTPAAQGLIPTVERPRPFMLCWRHHDEQVREVDASWTYTEDGSVRRNA